MATGGTGRQAGADSACEEFETDFKQYLRARDISPLWLRGHALDVLIRPARRFSRLRNDISAILDET